MTPKISIIIPVYNTEIYLKECLDSIINQTFKDIEIIVVNDCSSDNSEAVVLKYMSKDPRIKYIKHDKNKSLLQARITGAKIAIGDYLFHVDSDDYLYTLDALQILSDAIDSTQAEVIQFDIQANITGGWEWFIPLSTTLITNPQQIKDLYFNNTRCSTLWGRIIKRELYLKSVELIPKDLFVNMAEDFTQTPVIMYYANTYTSIANKIYFYRTGHAQALSQGQWTTDKLLLELISLKNMLSVLQILPPLYSDSILELLKFKILDRYQHGKHYMLLATQNSDFINKFIELFGIEHLLDFLPQLENSTITTIIDNIVLPPSSPITDNNKIGLISLQKHKGGSDRVHSLLFQEFAKENKETHIITRSNPNTFFPYPSSMKTLTLKDNISIYTQIKEYITKNSIKVCVVYDDHNDLDGYLLLVFLQSMGVRSIVYYHSDFFILQKQDSLPRQTRIAQLRLSSFPFADLICTLVPYNVEYLNLSGINNVICINNPLTIEPSEVTPSNLSKNTIVWCGRFEQEKNPFTTLVAFSQALPSLPKDTKLVMLGEGPEKNNLIDFINQHDLSKHVILPGFIDPTPYYQQASLHIMTSNSEAAPMVIAETKAFGVPTLMFELPEISFAKSKGIISVPQNDVASMSEQIIYLLNTPPVLQKLGQDALESLEDFSTKNTMLLWDKMIDAVCSNTVSQLSETHKYPDAQNLKLLIETLNKYYITENIILPVPEQHDKWYNFGQLSRKQKIKKIVIVISKKIKIYPILKYIYNIIKNKDN